LQIITFSHKTTYERLYFLGIENNNFEFVEYVIQNNNNLLVLKDALDSEGNTGLVRTVIESNIHIAKLLIKYNPTLVEMKNKVSKHSYKT